MAAVCDGDAIDTLSEGLLASVSAPSATSKHKTLQLHNPDSIVERRRAAMALARSLEELVCEPPDNVQESGAEHRVRSFVGLARSQQRLTDAHTR